MKRRPERRRIPAGHRLYFEAGGLTWRQPRPSVCARLTQAQMGVSIPMVRMALVDSGVDISDPDAVEKAMHEQASSADGFLAMSSTEEMMGAALGVCWAHPDFDLETPWPRLRLSVDALLEYGAGVLEELHEADLGIDFGAAYSAVMDRVQSAVLPASQEVDDLVGNGSTAEAPPTS